MSSGVSRSRRESNALLRRWCAAVPGDVLSIGSGHDGDGEGGRYRDYFRTAASYTTSECGERASTCDLALDVRWMPSVRDGRYDGVFCSGVLEHVDDCHAGVRECYRILKSGGVLLVGVPFRQPVHRAPQDFWRFTEFGLRWLLTSAGFVVEALEGIDAPDPVAPAAYWAQARRR